MFQSTLPLFSEPVNKLAVCTPERHLKHHVNLTTNNDNYGGPQLPHQNQMHSKLQIAHSKLKSLTANSNRSQRITNRSQRITNYTRQIQIAHSELQIAHSKLQIAHSKFKSPTANSNRSQLIEVAHSKFKSLPFCRGSRVFSRVSRVHCRMHGSL